MNNNPNNNNGGNDNIDDILDILQKRRDQNASLNNDPTRIDHNAVKPPEKKPKFENLKEPIMKKETHEKNSGTVSHVSSPSKNTGIDKSKNLNSTPSSSIKQPVFSKQNTKKPSPSDNAISLDDFDAMSKPARNRRISKQESQKNFYLPGYVKVIIYLAIVISVSIFLALTIINVSNDMFALVKNDKEIMINVDENTSLEEVADKLGDLGVIRYPLAYKMYAKIKTDSNSKYTGKIIYGEHKLNSNMNYDSIISALFETKYNNEIVRVTIPEGYTAIDIINLLQEKKVIDKDGKKEFISLLNDTTAFDYDFIPEMPATITDKDGNTVLDTNKKYLLEGYLFPDTYDFYIGENIKSVISKFLNNFDNKFEEAFYERCKELDMTVDEVITLASIIQSEGNNPSDFYLVSNVFHNRLNHPSVLGSTYPVLQSDATSAYAFNGSKKASELTSDEIRNVDSPYNSYKNHGFIPGAICNPGHDAIHAALYPAEYITEIDDRGNSAQIPVSYYYFYTASSNGKTYFSKNLNQHNAFVNADINKKPEELERLRKLYK